MRNESRFCLAALVFTAALGPSLAAAAPALATPSVGRPAPGAPTGTLKIQQVDSLGRAQHHKPAWVVQPDGRVVEVDSIGNRLYHRQQYQITGDRIVPISADGRVQWHRASPP